MTYLNSRAPSGHRICRHLRAKEMFYTSVAGNAGVDPGRAKVIDPELDDHHYWCTKSCRPRGPFGDEACLEGCSPERRCYEA